MYIIYKACDVAVTIKWLQKFDQLICTAEFQKPNITIKIVEVEQCLLINSCQLEATCPARS